MLPDISQTDHLFITQDIDAFEDHAEDLMDDLFGDVEHILSVENSQARANSTPVGRLAKLPKSSTSYVSNPNPDLEMQRNSNSLSLTKINLPAVQMPPISRQDILWIEPHINQLDELPRNNSRVIEEQNSRNSSNFLDSFLFGTACVSVMLTAVLWLINHGLGQNFERKLGNSNLSFPVAQSNGDATKFVEEVRNSLISINTKSNNNSSNSTNPNNGQLMTGPNGTVLAPMLNNGQMPTILNPLAGNVQPIYVPVYQPPALQNVGNNKSIATAPATLSSSSPSLNSNVASAPSYTLVGVLELGDRSSALLNIDGSVQPIRLGMNISNTGWILSRVGSQEITIKRGSETKSVFVGQRF